MIDALILGKINPFRSMSVGDPWQKTINVPEINKKATMVALETLDEVRSTQRASMALIKGDAGVGKTHLLARLREKALEQDFLFVNVRPLGDISRIYLHILQEIMISLRKKPANATTDDKYSPLEHFIGEIIALGLEDGLPDNQQAIMLAKSFALNPMKIFEIEPEKLYSTNLRKMASNQLIAAYPDVDVEFIEVLMKSIDPVLRPTAIKWLNGIDLSETDLQKLNVSNSISNEEKAIQIIHTIAVLARKPILLSFDQLESIHYRFKKDNGMLLFFDALTNLYNQCQNILELVMVQSGVWEEVKTVIPEYSLQRIDYVAELVPLDEKTIVLLTDARMKTVYDGSGIFPPYPTYPFTPAYLKILIRNVKGNPRLALRYLRDRINELKERGEVVEFTVNDMTETAQAKSTPGLAAITPRKIVQSSSELPATRPNELDQTVSIHPTQSGIQQNRVTPIVRPVIEKITTPQSKTFGLLATKWVEFARLYEQEIFSFPHPIRRDFTKGVFYDILTEAINNKQPLYGVTILNVRVDQYLVSKDIKGLDLVFTYQTPRGPCSVGIEINNSERGSTVFQSLRRLKKLVKGNIKFAFILRDEELSLSRTAAKSLELADSLSDFGGLYYVDFHSNQALQATKRLLDYASAGDLTVEDHTITRQEAISYIFEECLPRIKVFKAIFRLIKGDRDRSSSPSMSESSEAIEAIISILKFNPTMTIDRFCMFLNRSEEEISSILNMLSIRGIISFDGQNVQLL